MMMSEQVDLLTVTQAAHAIGTTRGAIHHHRLTGRLPAIVVAGKYLIPRESVEALSRDRAARPEHEKTASR